MTKRARRIGAAVGRGALGAALLCTALLCASTARAAPGDGTRLEYARSDRAARCPDQDALKSAVAKRLGYDPFFPAARQTIVVEITDAEGGLRAQMRLVDDQGMIRGSRELSDKVENCDELVASLALAISIALDPSAALGADPALDAVPPPATSPKKEASESAAAPSLGADVGARPAAPPPAQPKPHRDVPASSRLQAGSALPVVLRGSAFGALGSAPDTAFGVRAGVGFRAHWFQLVAEFNDQFGTSSRVTGGTARASLLSGTVAPCWAGPWFAGCVLLEAGSLRTAGRSVQSPLVQRTLYLATGARAEVDPVIVGPLRLLVNVDALKSLTPVTLRLYGEDVWRTPWLSLAASLGLELRFP